MLFANLLIGHFKNLQFLIIEDCSKDELGRTLQAVSLLAPRKASRAHVHSCAHGPLTVFAFFFAILPQRFSNKREIARSLNGRYDQRDVIANTSSCFLDHWYLGASCDSGLKAWKCKESLRVALKDIQLLKCSYKSF